MLAIYAVKTDCLPPFDELIGKLRFQVGERRDAWKRMPQARATESVAAMLLLQYALKRHGISLENCTVKRDENGRPFLSGMEIDFNLSHTEGFAVCAISALPSTRVGVDVERIGARRAEAIERVAARWFTVREQERLNAAEDRENIFLNIWTAKEAVVKRTGEGLSGLAKVDSEPNVDVDYEFACYSAEDATVTLCYTKGDCPPREILWVDVCDLIE